jgi:hypothetical protein
MYSFCPDNCCGGGGGGSSTDSKWTEEDNNIFRESDVAIGTSNVLSGNKLFVQGNISATGNVDIGNNYYFGNVALAEGLPTQASSKWVLDGSDIYRNSLVSINQGSVNTNNTLFVNGNANISGGFETSKLLSTGNIDCSSVNASLEISAAFYVGDGGGLSNIGGSAAGSRWAETAGGQIYRLSDVGIGNSDPTEALVVAGNVALIGTENNITFAQGGNITMEGNAYIFMNDTSGTTNGFSVGGTPFGILDSNFISESQIHTKLNSYWSHLGLTGEENIKFAMFFVTGSGNNLIVLNTIDRDFSTFDFGNGRYEITTDNTIPLANGKRFAVFCQTMNQAGFNFVNVIDPSPLLTTNGRIKFGVQTGDFTGFPSYEMVNDAKQFMCMVFLNDF